MLGNLCTHDRLSLRIQRLRHTAAPDALLTAALKHFGCILFPHRR